MPFVTNLTVLTDPTISISDGSTLCVIRMLRAVIDDIDESTYTNVRLLRALELAAFAVDTELCGCANVEKPDITCNCNNVLEFDLITYPAFTNLVVLKAACILNQGSARKIARSGGLTARCGPASISLDAGLSTLNTLMNKGPCESYEDLKNDLCFGYNDNLLAACGQVVATFTSSTYFTDGFKSHCASNKRCK